MCVCVLEDAELSAFRKYLADEYMILFNASFLPRSLRVTVKDSSSASTIFCELKVVYPFKFGSIIGKNYREKLSEKFKAKKRSELFKNIKYTLMGLVWQKKNQHEICVSK